jgi:hypothetical protein
VALAAHATHKVRIWLPKVAGINLAAEGRWHKVWPLQEVWLCGGQPATHLLFQLYAVYAVLCVS